MKNNLIKYISVVLFVASLFTGCSVQKRHYTKGYYVSWKNHNSPIENKRSLAVNSEKLLINSRKLVSTAPTINSSDAALSVSADKFSKSQFAFLASRILVSPPDSCGDKIVFKSGEEVLAKIEEVSASKISYRPCDHLDGPLRVVGTESLFMVKYANGQKEVFKTEAKPVSSGTPSKTNPVVKKKNGLASAAYIISFFSWFYLAALVSIIFGIIAMSQINKHPEKYTNRWQAVAGIIISAIFLLLFVAVLLLG
ncbi:MAG: DUF4190 domain-containing protein [bacterium]|nr:DUF4190 domain-containing protein [bacterium]